MDKLFVGQYHPVSFLLSLGSVLCCLGQLPCTAADSTCALTIQLTGPHRVTFVGAVDRWDADGNPRTPVDLKARIDSPRVSAVAQQQGSAWVFSELPPGRFDLVLLGENKLRLEGFHYPPVLEFDPALLHRETLAATTRELIVKDIAQSRHYENKVEPLFLTGDDKTARVLVQLLRDQPTSYDGQYGQPVATLRHEVWQYTNQYGGWVKERRTRVFDRILTGVAELRTWTWLWDPRLGGIELKDSPVTIRYEIPQCLDTLRGLRP